MMHRSLALVALLAVGCAPAPATVAPSVQAQATVATLLPSLATNVILPTYQDLATKADALVQATKALEGGVTQEKLEAARAAWKAARTPWERSESHLFGPASERELDPAMDSWPVDHNDLDKVLASPATLDATFIAGQQPTVKGFHALEYVLFANQPADLTPRKLTYATALATEFQANVTALWKAWDPKGEDFAGKYATTAFTTPDGAVAETLRSMAEICEEVAGSKIETPLAAKDVLLEESHFSVNTLADFRDNMEGVQAMYLGKYGDHQGLGFTHLVAAKDPALDAKVRQRLDAAIADLKAVPGSFADAITQHPDALRKAQASITALRDVLQKDVTLNITGKVSADAT
jgi:predicted lipoprotein